MSAEQTFEPLEQWEGHDAGPSEDELADESRSAETDAFMDAWRRTDSLNGDESETELDRLWEESGKSFSLTGKPRENLLSSPLEKGPVSPDFPVSRRSRETGNGETVLQRPSPVNAGLEFVPAAEFAQEHEPGATALVGDAENVLLPEGGEVMFYGDGGAGKTTLGNDLGAHMAAGDDWLEVFPVGRPVRVGLVENEGPRPLFRRKVDRKLRAWTGSPIGGRLLVLKTPWGKVSLDDPAMREALAAQIGSLELDVVIMGPITRSGMNEAGTLQQVRDYCNLLAEVRELSGCRVTFVLIHHENRGGQVSGAWEGAVDTLFHVQAQGNGQTRLFVQKARWAPEHHKRKLQLAWGDGESFEVIEKDERDDNEIADELLQFVLAHGGVAWKDVLKAEEVTGKGDRLKTIRDTLLAGGRLVNRGKPSSFRLWHADDPALPPAPSQATLDEEAA